VGHGAAAGTAGGGSLLGSMGALFTNPWTAVVAGAVIGGVLLWRHFRNRTEKRIKKAIQQEYGITITDSKLLTQIKQIGEQKYGKGKVSQNISSLIRLGEVKEIIAAHAEATGQRSDKLTSEKEYADPTSAVNNFVRREGSDTFVSQASLDRKRAEVFAQARSSAQTPVTTDALSGASTSFGGLNGTATPKPAAAGGGSIPATMLAAIIGALQQSTDTNEALRTKIVAMRPGDVVAAGADERPDVIAEANNKGLSRSTTARNNAGRVLGLA
jgi:hypothetical protein